MCVLSGMIGPFSKEGEVMMMMFYYLALKPATPPSKKLDKHTQAFCQNTPSWSKVFSWGDYPPFTPLDVRRTYSRAPVTTTTTPNKQPIRKSFSLVADLHDERVTHHISI